MRTCAVFLAALTLAQASVACPALENARPLSSNVRAAPVAFVSFDPPPVSEPFEMLVEFCTDTDAQVDAIAFDAIMPAHQHGMNYRATVSSVGDQTFRVTNVVFHMPGSWELRIEAEAAGQSYAYTGEVALE